MDADGLGLAGDGDQVEVARLDLVLRQAQRVFGDDHARSVDLLDAFELEDRLTVSPIIVKDLETGEPIVPTISSPVAMRRRGVF